MRRSQSQRRLLVTGRGVGKTHAAAEETIQVVMDAPPGSMGAVLAPTLTHAEAAVQKLREAAVALGVDASGWISTKRTLHLPGGRTIKVFSADRKEVVRGPSIVILWIEEGAYLSQKAYESSLPALRTGLTGVETRLLVTTTPAGGNWVKSQWDQARAGKLAMECFRFRSTESPYQAEADVEFARASMPPEKFAQEFLAEFVDNLLLAFPDREGLFVDDFPKRERKPACWLGVDIGQSDFTVCTLMSEWGEAEVVGRWNEDTPGFSAASYSRQTVERVVELLERYRAGLVVDTGSAGPGLGSVIATAARERKIAVVEIKTSSQGTKARVVEQARADVQWRKVTVKRNEHSQALDYELSKFQAIKRTLHGQELMIYEGPQFKGEHDDCVISFCLANWGRVHGEKAPDLLGGDFSEFATGTDMRPDHRSDHDALGDWSP